MRDPGKADGDRGLIAVSLRDGFKYKNSRGSCELRLFLRKESCWLLKGHAEISF